MRTLQDFAAVSMALFLTACPPDKPRSDDAEAIPPPAVEPNAVPLAPVASPNLVAPSTGKPARPLVAPSAH